MKINIFHGHLRLFILLLVLVLLIVLMMCMGQLLGIAHKATAGFHELAYIAQAINDNRFEEQHPGNPSPVSKEDIAKMTDRWGNKPPIFYSDSSFVIIGWGKDGLPGGSGDDRDIFLLHNYGCEHSISGYLEKR